MDERQTLHDFMAAHSLATVATADADGRLANAVVGFGETKRLELIFGTFISSQKYQNLQTRPSVAIVIGWENGLTLQYRGRARELAGSEAEFYAEQYFAKSPAARQYQYHPEERYFLVTPEWLRLTDLKTEPWTIVELDQAQLQYDADRSV